MKNINYKNISLLIIAIGSLIIGMTGCKKFIQIGPPISSLETSTVFEDPIAATAAQLRIYTTLPDISYNISANNGLLSDELKAYSTLPLYVELYSNSMLASNAPTFWGDAYANIYKANANIEGLSNSKSINSKVKNQLLGEAKFVRAFFFFYLTNLYGDLPLTLTSDYNVNKSISRSPQALVYTQIEKDLNEAKDLLADNFVDVSDTTITTERVRPTKAAAKSLLARTYLSEGKYSQALNESTDVISNSLFALPTDLNSVFLKNSEEAIWQIQVPAPNTINTVEGQNFILLTPPVAGYNTNVAIANTLLDSFEIGDLRKANWIGSIAANSTTYYFPYKYKVQTGSDVTEYTMVLRLAEQYLIRAEANANLNNLNDATNDLNTIRTRAGLSNYSGPSSKDSILAAIYKERKLELFTEWGHRWLDLKRTNQIDTYMPSITALKGGTWRASKKWYPIPQSEVGANPKLTQNQDY